MAFIEPDPIDLYELWKHRNDGSNGHMSTEYKAMYVRQCLSGMTEDVYVNNFTFLADDNHVSAADDIAAALTDFYEGTNPAYPVGAYLHPCVSNAAVIKVYKLSDAKPREPVTRTYTSSVTRANGQGIPEEAAITLSFSAAAPHTARRRGRVYLGPLNVGTVEEDASSKASYVRAACRADIAAAAVRLANHEDAGWLIHSTMAGGTFSEVVTGWIDDAFDTQRRRGPDARSRYTWAKA
jgi:hypothetical protein